MVEFYLGTMGFSYKDWKGVFYPPNVPAEDYLAYYSRFFNSVEMDTTFYAVPRKASVQGWAASVPDNFSFAVKTPQSITHQMGLANTQQFMDEFIGVMRLLGDKLGVILIQLPPSFSIDKLPTFTTFINQLPADVHFAVEFRHRSWYTGLIADLLSAHHICWAATEFGNLPHQITPTSEFLYIRWLGKRAAFRRYNLEQIDQGPRLSWWREQITSNLQNARMVFGYINNDYSGFAPATCNRIKTMFDLPTSTFQQPEQGRLF